MPPCLTTVSGRILRNPGHLGSYTALNRFPKLIHIETGLTYSSKFLGFNNSIVFMGVGQISLPLISFKTGCPQLPRSSRPIAGR